MVISRDMEGGKRDVLLLPTNLEPRLEGWGGLPVGSNHSATHSDRQHGGEITLDVGEDKRKKDKREEILTNQRVSN